MPILPVFPKARVRHAFRLSQAFRYIAVSVELPKSSGRGYLVPGKYYVGHSSSTLMMSSMCDLGPAPTLGLDIFISLRAHMHDAHVGFC